MKQQITPRVSDKNFDTLWWRPFFSMQKKMNKQLNKEFKHFFSSSLFDVEKDIFSTTQNNLHNLFSEIFNNRQLLTPLLTCTNSQPYVDIIENSTKFKVRVEVGGLGAKDLEVSIADNALVISGKKVEEAKEDGDKYIHHESCSSEFSRVIALPKEADVYNATAAFDKNVLTVEVPKKEKKHHKVNIESANSEQGKTPVNKREEQPVKVKFSGNPAQKSNEQVQSLKKDRQSAA
jgi:HSP20 family protein